MFRVIGRSWERFSYSCQQDNGAKDKHGKHVRAVLYEIWDYLYRGWTGSGERQGNVLRGEEEDWDF